MNKKKAQVEIQITEDELEDIREGKEFDWEFETIMEDGQLIIINTVIKLEDQNE